MKYPYGLMADIHLHNWSAFSTVDKNGQNTRLVGLLSEIVRCATETKKAGGDTIVVAGDLFHVRGSIAPSVLNPTLDTFAFITSKNDAFGLGMNVIIMPGNHDLEGKHSKRLSSAVTALESVGCRVLDSQTAHSDLLLVPWVENLDELRGEIKASSDAHGKDLIIHAPVNGVIMGIPNTGLATDELQRLGYRRVFAGHYHNHVEFPGGVYSIGALAHHTWSDVGSKAGFVLVHEDRVEWRKSQLPEFIDVSQDMLEHSHELPMLIDGNYCRIRIETDKASDLKKNREYFESMGAKGVIMISVKKPVVERSGSIAASVRAGASLESSVAEFIKSKSYPNADKVSTEAQKVLAEAGVE